MSDCKNTSKELSRRSVLKSFALGTATLASGSMIPGLQRYTQAQSSEPIRIGFQMHRTGIGATYGRWYSRTSEAAVKRINESGGINGRPVELITEDDKTNPRIGAAVVEKFNNIHKCDVVFGTLFSHVVTGSAPTAGKLKIPYFLASEGYDLASGALNRYTLQPGITDVRSQVISVAPYIANELGKKVTIVYPDFNFGYNHRDFFSAAFEAQGGTILKKIAIPPTAKSFTQYFSQIPSDTEVIYHVMIGPFVLNFVKEMGEYFGSVKPAVFGFIDSLEGFDFTSEGLEFLEDTYFWEGHPRYAQPKQSSHEIQYRQAVGVDDNGASTSDSNDVSTYGHMFSCWETLYVIKAGMEACNYQGTDDRTKLIEAIENISSIDYSDEHPQGAKEFNGRTHQVFGHQHVSKVTDRKLLVAHTTSIEESYYEDEVDYTTHSF